MGDGDGDRGVRDGERGPAVEVGEGDPGARTAGARVDEMAGRSVPVSPPTGAAAQAPTQVPAEAGAAELPPEREPAEFFPSSPRLPSPAEAPTYMQTERTAIKVMIADSRA